jgi:hypothetical protein
MTIYNTLSVCVVTCVCVCRQVYHIYKEACTGKHTHTQIFTRVTYVKKPVWDDKRANTRVQGKRKIAKPTLPHTHTHRMEAK